MKYRAIVLLIITAIFCFSDDTFAKSADNSPPSMLAYQFIEVTGLDLLLDSIPEYFEISPFASDGESPESFINNQIAKILEEKFSSDAAKETLAKYLDENADIALFTSIIKWHKTPIAKRIIIEERKAASTEGEVDFLRFIESEPKRSLDNIQESQRELIREILSITRGIEAVSETLKRFYIGRLEIFNLYLPNDKKIPPEYITTSSESFLEQIKGTLRGRLQMYGYYIYRNQSCSELSEIRNFSSSPTGRDFITLSNNATMHVINELLLDVQKEVVSWELHSCFWAREDLKQGKYLIETERYDEALSAYKLAIEKSPECISAHDELTKIYMKKNRYYDAIEIVNEIVSLKPNRGEAYHMLAQAYIKTGNLNAAQVQLDTLDKLDVDPKLIDPVKDLISEKRKIKRLPQHKVTTSRDFYRQYYNLFKRLIVQEYYIRNSEENTAQSGKILQFLTRFCQFYSDQPSKLLLSDLVSEGKSLAENGAKSPIFKMCFAILLNKSGEGDRAESILLNSSRVFYNDNFPYIYSYLTSKYIACNLIDKGQKKNTAFRFWRKYCLRSLAQAIKANEFPDHNIVIAYELLKDLPDSFFGDKLWHNFFFQLNELEVENEWLLNMVSGRKERNDAWEARGSGYANSVTEEGWRKFREHMFSANDFLVKAWELHPEYPQAAVSLIKVANAGGSPTPNRTTRYWFDQAIKAQVDYPGAYTAYAWSLRPRWGGSLKQLESFGLECLLTSRYDTDIPLFYLYNIKGIAEEIPNNGWRNAFRGNNVYNKLSLLYNKLLEVSFRSPKDIQHIKALQALTEVWVGNYDKAYSLLDSIPPDLKLSDGFWGTSLSCFDRQREDIINEIKAFKGSGRNLLHEAEAYEMKGDITNAQNLYSKALDYYKENNGVRIYIANRIGFLKLRKKVTEQERWNKWTPLHWAAEENNVELAQFLVDQGIAIDSKNIKGQAPLQFAAYSGSKEVADILLKNGADINTQAYLNASGNYPIHSALDGKQPEMALFLINKGANVNVKDALGWTPLHYAAHYSYDGVCQKLLESGANINATTLNGHSIESIARYTRNKRTRDIINQYRNKNNPKKKKIQVRKLMRVHELKKLVERNENDYEAHFWLGNKYNLGKNFSMALVEYNKVIEFGLTPYLADAYNTQGRILMDQDRINESVKSFNASLKIDPANISTYLGLGKAYEKLNDYANAKATYERGLRYKPKNSPLIKQYAALKEKNSTKTL